MPVDDCVLNAHFFVIITRTIHAHGQKISKFGKIRKKSINLLLRNNTSLCIIFRSHLSPRDIYLALLVFLAI